jgi:hydroxypyruvate reductase
MDAARLLQEYGLETRLPAEVTVCLSSGGLPETPKPGDAVFDRSMWHVLLDSATLEQAAALRAIALGWHVEIDHRCDDWTADDAAAYLVDKISRMRERQERVCLISGGEVTVRLPASGSGVGGRNQHFALLCAQRIVGREMCVLSCGSDGMDGNSPAAGAMVDGNTMLRAEQAGYSLDQTLARFDSHSLLSLLGDTVVTGPSGTNVRDLRVLLAP